VDPSLLSAHHGKVRAVARSARSSRRRFGGVLEPLTRVRADWVELPGRELHRLEGLEGLRSFAAMQSDPLRQAACAILSEVCMSFAHEEQDEHGTFRLLGAVAEALEADGAPRPLLRYFEAWMLRLHGLSPDLDHCSLCGAATGAGRLRYGVTTGARCGTCPSDKSEHEIVLDPADRAFLDEVRRRPPGALGAGGTSRALEQLLRGTLESFAERTFRTYRHFAAAEASLAPRGGQ
jgi:DNA repair protein RecO (recombination protein O)